MERDQFVVFNKDASCFATTASIGIHVFNSDPFRLSVSVDLPESPKIIEMLDRTNLIAIVEEQDPTRAKIWDNDSEKIVAEMRFKTEVTGLKMSRDLIIVSLSS
jgi:hypothetical protein